MTQKAIDGLDVVIVDVLRATTTIVFAVSRGARVLPLADDAEAIERARVLGDAAILAGEHLGTQLAGFHCNNSPTELAKLDLANRTVVMVTTNGTRAIAACASAQRVFAGALTNAPALGRALCRNGALERDLAIVCAGRNTGALAFEDLLGAGAIASAVVESAAPGADLWLADGARLARNVFEQHRPDLSCAVASSDAAQELVEKGYADDVVTCGTLGEVMTVPLLVDGQFAVYGS
jgi:2-phosphosulfolactate phosphatase